MTDEPTNPPAFPQLEVVADERDGHGDFIDPFTVASGGMSLRDYFAAHVAQGMAAFSGTAGTSYGPHEIAGRSYQIADAMLEHRGKSNAE